jgi:hypothetical protein
MLGENENRAEEQRRTGNQTGLWYTGVVVER